MKNKYESIEVSVSDLHPDGYGVAESSYGVLAIPGALAGEKLSVLPTKKKKKLRFASLISVLQPSPDRIPSACSVAEKCGGCSFQHYSSDAQVRFKESQLVDLFEAIQPNLVSSQIISTPITGLQTTYRCKARLGVKFVEKKGKVLVGFREKLGGYITEMSRCEILAEPFNDLIPELEFLIGELSDPKSIPQLEIASGEESAAMVVRHLRPVSGQDIVSLQNFGRRHSIGIYLQPGDLESVHKIYPESGEDRLYYSLKDQGIRFAFHPMDFIQVNQGINQKLVSRVLELLEIDCEDQVLDLFCGIGNFSLPIASKVKFVTGMELSPESISRAKENARLNAIQNASFIEKNLFTELEDLDATMEDHNKVLIDPPRTGALEVMEKLVNTKVERVVYVSCNPKTLARDANILCRDGRFRLASLGLVDMFPHTTHMETVASFIRH